MIVTTPCSRLLYLDVRLHRYLWDYPNSVDRCQGFTVESVRVLMNCCS
jgi:hypothetical protein